MKITKIQLTNFRSHARTEIGGLGRYVVFLGPNGAGKSTILDAIGYALTGVCRGVDDRGQGADHLVTRRPMPPGQEDKAPKSFGVSLATTKGAIVRGLGEGPKSKVQSEIGRKYGIDPVLARALVQTASFTRLAPATQKQIVLSVAASKVSAEDILKLLGPSAGLFDATSIPLDSVEAIDQAEKDLRALRPDLKRQIAAVAIPDLPEGAGEAAATSIQEAEAALKELREEKDKLVRDRTAYDAKRSELLRRRQDLSNRNRAALAKLDKAKQDLVGGNPGPEIAAGEDQIVTLGKEEAERSKAYQALKSEVDTLSGQLEALRVQHNSFTKLKGSCPTCQRAITKSDGDAVLKIIKDQGAKINGQIKPKEKELEKLAYDQAAGQKLAGLKSRLDELKNLARIQHYAKQAEAEATSEIASVNAALGEVDSALRSPEPAKADTSEIDSEIAKGEEFVGKQRALVEAMRARAAAVKTKTDLDTRLSNCEELIEKLGPKGPVRAKLMEGGGDQFVAEVNQYAKAVGLGPVYIDLSSGFALWVNGSPAALLSASEDYRLNLAFAAALSKRSGTGILILDGAEILDGNNRGAVNEVLAAAGLEQAFLAATPEEMPQGLDPVPDWSIFAVTKRPDGISAVAPLAAPVAA